MAVSADGGRSGSTYFARAIVDSRSTLHLSYRLVVRLVQWSLASGADSPGAGLWRAALPAFVVLDVVVWLVLRRNTDYGLKWRLALDCADVAFWSLSPRPLSGQYDAAVLIAIPLSIEAGFRTGIRGVVVPVAVAVAAGAVRALAGESVLPFSASWLILGLGLGMALFSYCRKLDEYAEAERSRLRAADDRWAFLVGQNDVAMGADSVVDVLEGLVPVLGRPGNGSALWRLADGWKARLAADTAVQAAYLQVVLLGWESGHNRHPDLSSRVEIHLGEGAGTTILTGRQVGWLHAALDRRQLRGGVQVSLAGSQPHRMPGAALELDVGDHRLRIPADRAAAIQPVDVGPVTYGLVAAQLLGVLTPDRGGVPPAAVAAGILVCAITAWWSHRLLLRRGLAARPAIVGAALAAAVAITLLTAPLVTEPFNPNGDTNYVAFGVLLLAFLGGMYSDGMQPRLAALVGIGVVACAVLPVILTPAPLSFRSFLGSVAWNVAPFAACRHISRSLARATERHLEETVEEDEHARADAFLQGQESVVALVRLARDDARAQLAVVAPELEPTLRALVGHRLEEVDRRLLSLAPTVG